MPYYSRPGDDNVDDFDEFDPTPYGGGYDIVLTYGRPLEPSDEICYPSSTPYDGDFDYARPHFSSGGDHFAYADEALQTEYSSYARPKRRPGLVYGGGSAAEHDHPAYGRRPQYEQHESGYGQKPEYEGGPHEYGTGHPRLNEGDYGSSYGRSEEEEGGYRKSSYRRKDDDDGSDDEKRKSYGRKDDDSDDEKRKSYGYGGEEGYGRKKHGGNSSDEDEDDEEKKQHRYKHHHHKRHDVDDE
ncbi:hypothetical protein PTKIN_Ptkin08bG0059600 [Pterospermum kingtungense]